MIANALFTIVS